jgi:hypothetical protein
MIRPINWRLLVSSGALILLGAALGIAFDRMHHRRVTVAIMHGPPPGPGAGVTASFAMLDSLLELRPEQRERVRAILLSRQEPIDSIWATTHRSLRTSLDSTAGELEAILDSHQRDRLNALLGGLRNPSPTPTHNRH